MGKEQRAVCSGGLVIEVAVLLKLGVSPSGNEEADNRRISGTTGVGIGVIASVLAQPTASTVQQHTAKLWVLWHCWARIEDAVTVGPGFTAAAPRKRWLYSLMDEGVGGWVWKRGAR